MKDEFDAFLECGILAHGFLRLRCGDCGHDKLVAFSCKRRGFCPSCGARRMAQTAAHLVDHVIPHVPVRQWVLSLPIPLRLLLAAQPKPVTPVLQVVHRVITRFLLDQAGLKAEQADSGAVTLIQHFGSAANLNIHLHCLVLDGVYRCDWFSQPRPAGHPTPAKREDQRASCSEGEGWPAAEQRSSWTRRSGDVSVNSRCLAQTLTAVQRPSGFATPLFN